MISLLSFHIRCFWSCFYNTTIISVILSLETIASKLLISRICKSTKSHKSTKSTNWHSLWNCQCSVFAPTAFCVGFTTNVINHLAPNGFSLLWHLIIFILQMFWPWPYKAALVPYMGTEEQYLSNQWHHWFANRQKVTNRPNRQTDIAFEIASALFLRVRSFPFHLKPMLLVIWRPMISFFYGA